jgi:hypothetical protein
VFAAQATPKGKKQIKGGSPGISTSAKLKGKGTGKEDASPSRSLKAPKDGKGCWICQGDHFASQCPSNQAALTEVRESEEKKKSAGGGGAAGGGSGGRRKSAQINVATTNDSSSDDEDAVDFSVVLAYRVRSDNELLLDTQASYSVFKNKKLFTDMWTEEDAIHIEEDSEGEPDGTSFCVR